MPLEIFSMDGKKMLWARLVIYLSEGRDVTTFTLEGQH